MKDFFRFVRDPAPRALDTPRRFLSTALVFLAVVQAAVLAIADRGAAAIVAIVLTVATLNLRLRYLGLLTALIIINFAIHLAGLTPPFPYRLAHASIVAAYGAIALSVFTAALLDRIFRRRRMLGPALIVGGSIAVLVVAVEAWTGRYGPTPPSGEVRWIGKPQPQAIVGEVNPPYGVLRTVYPDNPRGFFDQSGPSLWTVDVHDPGSEALLDLSPDRPALLRVQIVRADVLTPSNIQLNGPAVSVKGGATYELSFRARADGERRIAYGLATAGAPPTASGASDDAAIGTDWREFSATYVPAADDAGAHVHFDVGDNPEPVEIQHAVLRLMPSGAAVHPAARPPAATEYSLTYEFNAYGCRGDDYPIPRPADRRRILVLGAGQALGVGVHQWQTFSARLEHSLNTPGAAPATPEHYEVINCGASGYATRQERQFYEVVGSIYQPNVVILTMTDSDNMSRRDRERLGYVHQIGKYEQLLFTDHLFQLARHEWRAPANDYSGAVDDVVKLEAACRARGGRLAVVIFRTSPLVRPWRNLVTAVSSRLQGTAVPFIDLGPTLLKDHTPDDLRVHRIDANPNEIAHRIAATEIEQFLRRNHLVG